MTRRDTFGSTDANESRPDPRSELELQELMRSRNDAKRGVDRINMTIEIVKYAAIIIALVLGLGRLLTRSNAPTVQPPANGAPEQPAPNPTDQP
ncbi:MAG: hypothetical protein II596_03105 [Thermoguttaceae bacterium]|nr:hypothetical protein [Thermoguttaceae bacterium]